MKPLNRSKLWILLFLALALLAIGGIFAAKRLSSPAVIARITEKAVVKAKSVSVIAEQPTTADLYGATAAVGGMAGEAGTAAAGFEPCTKCGAGRRRPAYWRSSRVPSPRRRTLPSTMKPASRGSPLSKSTCSQPLRAFQRPLNSFALALRTQVFGARVRTTA